jgi:hypothetical protein
LLEDELCQWADRPATLWWRDDDVASDSAALAALLSIARDHDAAIALAAIPAKVDATLVNAIDRCAPATVVQHGYAHANHARSGERSVELGGDRSLDDVVDELQRGRDVLSRTFKQRFRSILVPPWNRIAEPLIPRLAGIGLRGLSCFGPRSAPLAAPGVALVNTHVDLIAWKRGRLFIGEEAAIARIVAHLAARRRGEVDDEPTGVLTHHLAFGDDAFAFLRELIARTSSHRHVRWLDVDAAFH